MLFIIKRTYSSWFVTVWEGKDKRCVPANQGFIRHLVFMDQQYILSFNVEDLLHEKIIRPIKKQPKQSSMMLHHLTSSMVEHSSNTALHSSHFPSFSKTTCSNTTGPYTWPDYTEYHFGPFPTRVLGRVSVTRKQEDLWKPQVNGQELKAGIQCLVRFFGLLTLLFNQTFLI